MNRRIILTTSLICIAFLANAQSYKWVKGGGSIVDLSLLSSSQWEAVTQMCTDENGNVYITANVGVNEILADTFYMPVAHNNYFSDVNTLVASYTCNGTMRWAKLIECWGDTKAGGLVYSKGSVYLSGSLPNNDPSHLKYIGNDTNMAAVNQRSFTARFDTSGQYKWIRFVGSDVPNTFLLTGDIGVLAADKDGNIHNFNIIKPGCILSPSFTTTLAGTYDLKYDSLGTLLDAARVPSMDSIWMMAKAVYSPESNKWFATMQPNTDYWYAFHPNWNSALCAFNPDNSLAWIDTTGMPGGLLALDYKGGNKLYVSGAGQYPGAFTFGGITVSNTDFGDYETYAVLFQVDTLGTSQWAYNLNGNLNIASFNNVTILPNGNLAAIGDMTGTLVHGTDTIISTPGEGQNPLFAIIDSTGHTVFLDQLHGGGFYDGGAHVASDKVGNTYLGGLISADMGTPGIAPYISHGGNTDFYVLKYGYECDCLAAPPAASFTSTVTGITSPYTATFTYSGTTSYDSIRWNFGDGSTATIANPSHTYTTMGSYNVCVTIYTQCGSNTYCHTIQAGTTGVLTLAGSQKLIYPNPANNSLNIEQGGIGSIIRIYDITGRQVYDGVVNSEHEQINTTALTPATYLLQLTDTYGNRTNLKIIKE